jgi:SAM-dependent methyltransferase
MSNDQRFTGLAGHYSLGRPGYANEAIDYICGLTQVGVAASSVVDVGAGAGKLTGQLAGRFAQVWAVEPNADMLAVLTVAAKDWGSVHVVAGTAEATTLPTGCADLIVAGQAFHWFDPAEFRAECTRLGGPDVPVAIVYNTPGPGNLHEELAWWRPAHAAPRWDDRVQAIRDFFEGYVVAAEFPHPLHYDHDAYLANMMSHSTTPRPDDPAYSRYLASVEAIFEGYCVDGVMTVSNTTVVYSSSRGEVRSLDVHRKMEGDEDRLSQRSDDGA